MLWLLQDGAAEINCPIASSGQKKKKSPAFLAAREQNTQLTYSSWAPSNHSVSPTCTAAQVSLGPGSDTEGTRSFSCVS